MPAVILVKLIEIFVYSEHHITYYSNASRHNRRNKKTGIAKEENSILLDPGALWS
jgi:hypothetical protein